MIAPDVMIVTDFHLDFRKLRDPVMTIVTGQGRTAIDQQKTPTATTTTGTKTTSHDIVMTKGRNGDIPKIIVGTIIGNRAIIDDLRTIGARNHNDKIIGVPSLPPSPGRIPT